MRIIFPSITCPRVPLFLFRPFRQPIGALASMVVILLSLRAVADGSLQTDVAYIGQGEVGSSNTQTGTPAASLSDQAAGNRGNGIVTVNFGSISVAGFVNCPIAPDGSQASESSDGQINDNFIVTTSGAPGDKRTLRFNMHLSGSVQGRSEDQGGWKGSYELQVSAGAAPGVDYTYFADQFGSHGTRADDVGTFTMDAPITAGSSQVQVVANLKQSILCNGTGPQATPAGGGQASTSLAFAFGNMTVLDAGNQPMNYTAEARTGSARGLNVPANGAYSQYTLTNNAPNRVGTKLSLLDGTAGTATSVTAAFVAPPSASEIKLVSDAVELDGTGSDPVVVQMSYDAVAAQSIFGSSRFVELAWFQNSSKRWKNAVLGNSGSTQPSFFNRAYNPATDFHLGYYGNDTANHLVWAVVNHGSKFAVTIPLPSLALTSVAGQSARVVHLNGNWEPGRATRIEASPDLSPNSFSTLTTVTADATGGFQYDSTATAAKMFYRVVYP